MKLLQRGGFVQTNIHKSRPLFLQIWGMLCKASRDFNRLGKTLHKEDFAKPLGILMVFMMALYNGSFPKPLHRGDL